MSTFEYNTTIENNIMQIDLSGRIIEKDQTDALIAEVENGLEKGAIQVVLNLEQLEYINSSGLNSFIAILTKTRNKGGEVVIANVPQKINQLFLISKLSTVFTITETLDEAKELLQTNKTI